MCFYFIQKLRSFCDIHTCVYMYVQYSYVKYFRLWIILDNLERRRQNRNILIDVGNSVALEIIESNMKSILIYVTQTSAPGTKGDKSVSWVKPWPTIRLLLHLLPLRMARSEANEIKLAEQQEEEEGRRRSRRRSRVRVMQTMDRDGFDCCYFSPLLIPCYGNCQPQVI